MSSGSRLAAVGDDDGERVAGDRVAGSIEQLAARVAGRRGLAVDGDRADVEPDQVEVEAERSSVAAASIVARRRGDCRAGSTSRARS